MGRGTSSRRVKLEGQAYAVGALVQANYGSRASLRIAGVPVGQELPTNAQRGERERGDTGSIIIVVGTDAPLLPHQLDRIAKRAALGLARMGSYAGNGSGDFIVAFSTANAGAMTGSGTLDAKFLDNDSLDGLFEATAQATEEAIVKTMSRIDVPGHGNTVKGLYQKIEGIAFAGSRGVRLVEISTDEGKSWSPANLAIPLSSYAWVFWSYDWAVPAPGRYTLLVRATDGTGSLQTSAEQDPSPDGASGLHEITIAVST